LNGTMTAWGGVPDCSGNPALVMPFVRDVCLNVYTESLIIECPLPVITVNLTTFSPSTSCQGQGVEGSISADACISSSQGSAKFHCDKSGLNGTMTAWGGVYDCSGSPVLVLPFYYDACLNVFTKSMRIRCPIQISSPPKPKHSSIISPNQATTIVISASLLLSLIVSILFALF
jgi:hypothetical protein